METEMRTEGTGKQSLADEQVKELKRILTPLNRALERLEAALSHGCPACLAIAYSECVLSRKAVMAAVVQVLSGVDPAPETLDETVIAKAARNPSSKGGFSEN